MPTATHDSIQDLAGRFENAPPEELLKWALGKFGANISLACSLGAEDVVLVDFLTKLEPNVRIFVLDTGRLHEETYAVMERIRERYDINFEVYNPNTEHLQQLLRLKGPSSFYASIDNRKECCGIRKVEPLQRALRGPRGMDHRPPPRAGGHATVACQRSKWTQPTTES